MGQVSLDLNKCIRPSKYAESCGFHQIPRNDFQVETVSLFEQRRLKGWWPCIVELSNNRREIAGKLELELEILNEEEASSKPAGKGRDEPNHYPQLNIPKYFFCFRILLNFGNFF